MTANTIIPYNYYFKWHFFRKWKVLVFMLLAIKIHTCQLVVDDHDERLDFVPCFSFADSYCKLKKKINYKKIITYIFLLQI